MGVPRKKRRVKTEIDRMAAAIILQDYLDSRDTPGGGARS
jgi:RNase H-fold protein (predicted Holliday junction resolvase)